MHPLTQPIRVVFNTREPGYRTKTYLGYAMLFVLMAGDAVRYSVGWGGWIAILAVLFAGALTLIIKNEPARVFGLAPTTLWVLLGWMLLSSIWSFYQALTVGASFVQLATTIAGLFFAGLFSWRHLLKVFADVVRFILGGSLIFELYAALVVRGPIEPIFKNYSGDTPPASAFLWTQGHLFDGQRIQGIVGNSNLLAYVAMIGLVVFAVEYAIIGAPRWISIVSLGLALGAVALARSSGIDFALAAVAVSAVVSIAAEGKPKEIRHRYYRFAWSAAAATAAVILLFRREVFDLLGKSPDMTGRTGIWKLVLALIEDRPLLGWGWISHWVPGVKPYEGLVVINNVPYYQAHNAFLDVWLQLGVIGLLIFGLLILFTFIPLWRLAVRHTSSLYLWPILLFIGLLVQALVESRMLIEIGWVMLVIFAAKANEPDDVLEPRGRSSKRARFFAILKGLLTLAGR
jgi:O-antigen ligase